MTKHDVSHLVPTLVIDTTESDRTRVGLINQGSVTVTDQPVRAQELQRLIAALLDQASLTFQDIRSVACLVGPGSYTGTRIGIATANTLGWLNRLPLIEIEDLTFEAALKKIQSASEFPVTKQIKPRY